MNKIKSFIGLALCALVLTGCAMFNGQSDASKRIITSTKVAAFVGTSEYVRQHPETRPAFEKAAAELEAFENSETLDAATLIAIVHRLPVKELKSERAAIYITAATIMLEDWTDKIPIEKLNELKPVAKAIREGIQLGLILDKKEAMMHRVIPPSEPEAHAVIRVLSRVERDLLARKLEKET